MFLLTDATIYVGGLDEKVTDPTLWELFLQAGPVGKLFISTLIFVNLLLFTNCILNLNEQVSKSVIVD